MFFFKKIPLSILILTPLCLLSWSAQAQPYPTEPTSVIPYQGTLFSQGKPVSQDNDVLMAFALYSGDVMSALPPGTTNEAPDVALAEESPSYNRLWTSWATEDGALSELSRLTVDNPHTLGVKVRNGRFLVHLGAAGQTALPDSIFDQRPLYVLTWVVNGSGVFRLPPQKLEKVPHAVTAERANSFEVMGNLSVAGTLQAHGATELKEGVSVDGLAEFRGDVKADRLQARTNGGNLEIASPLRVGSTISDMLTITEMRGPTGTVATDGEWHNIVTGVNGLRAYQVVARASKAACHSMGHFITVNVYGDTSVQPTQVTAGSPGCAIELRWTGIQASMSLQIRSAGPYAPLGANGDSPNIKYSIIRLLEF